jgi:Ribonuclease E/G family
MSKQIVIAEQHRIAAVFDAEQIQELVVATGTHQVSDIYLGVVENVLPGIDAAFVNIGDSDRNGFIHVTDLGPLRLRRSAASITELLAPQQKVLVQVMKEPTGTKGPRLTGNISLPGRYLVLMPYGRGVNLSRRIGSENERNRLRAYRSSGSRSWPKPPIPAPLPCSTGMTTSFNASCEMPTTMMSTGLWSIRSRVSSASNITSPVGVGVGCPRVSWWISTANADRF